MSDAEPEPPATRRLPTLDKTPGDADGPVPSDADGPTPSDADAPATGTAGHERVRRFWSARRLPAALVALVLLAAAGLLLYDVAAVRAGRPAMAWRRRLARELATRHLDNPWVLGAAAVAVVLGVWLIVSAVTPGLRQVLPMRRAAPDIRAGLDRAAAALVLRDRAMEVAGVQSVRVAVSRRKAKAHAVSHFRELDEVRADLDVSLAEGLRQLGLARELRLTVDVRRPKKR
ncbi:DUF6286 domain-containing protein [Streptomyces sp. NPDC058773]|uniref:DUF6286 domain-containing protein n=1 Tax=Streptomyces sp. NPDC058773 TaxID=3346632 RepID=UPI0036935882